jgi:hypothetical protein
MQRADQTRVVDHHRHSTPPQKDQRQATPPRRRPTHNPASAPAERVRVTDVPLVPGGRAYLVERGLEEEGANANAALHALIEDYLRQASILDEVPMAAIPL